MIITSASVRHAAVLVVSLLTACASSHAADPRESGTVYGDFLAGSFAAGRDDFATAASALLQAAAEDPQSDEVVQQAFLAALLDGRPEAVSLAARLPGHVAAQMVLADDAARKGEWERAITRYDALPHEGVALTLQPLLVAWAEQGAGHTDAAMATLRPYMQGKQLRAVYALHAALIADLAGREAEAQQLYEAAAAEYGPANLRLAQILASWEARQGRVDRARRMLQGLADTGDPVGTVVPALLAHPETRAVASPADGIAEAYLALAATMTQQGDRNFGLVLGRLALDMRPDLTAVRLLLADSLAGAHQPVFGLRLLAKVPADDPLIALVDLRRAALQNQAGQTDAAIALLQRLIAADPARPEAANELGDLLREQGKFAEAVAAYDIAVSRIPRPRPGDWPLFFARGITEDRLHHWEAAQSDLERALQLSPNEPFVLNYLAYSWAEQGRNLPEARRMLEQAMRQRPDDGAIIDSLGWVLLRGGDAREALRLLERAAELQPEDPTINGHLGDAYWADGAKLQAAYQWRLALSLKPDAEDVPRLQAKLKEAEVALGAATPVTPTAH